MARSRYQRPDVPHGAYILNYRPGTKKDRREKAEARDRAYNALPEEEKQRRREEWARYQADMDQWRKLHDTEGPEAAAAWLNARRPMGNTNATSTTTDEQARIAVEGDTATDDASFGEPEQLPGQKDIADLDPNRVLLANCIECRARIYEGDDHHVSEDDEFCCAKCADEGARS